MWTTLLIVAVVFLVAMRIVLSVKNQIELVSAALVATACLMIALGIAPLSLKLTLLLTIALVFDAKATLQPA
ncbi:MAG: hypothetical protein AAFZ49_14940, partial [Cyanobacteria bacterium J06659_2]